MRTPERPLTTRRNFLGIGLRAGAGLAVAAPVLSACGGGGSPAGTSDFPSRPDVEAAKQEGKVTLYTSLDTKIVDSIIAPFKKKYGIEVEYYRGGAVDVTNKVLAEASVKQIRADVVDASDVSGFLVMQDKGLLHPYKSPETKNIRSDLRDEEYHWVADRLTQAIIQYNTDKLPSAEVPRTWEDLTEAALNGKLAFFSAPNGDGAPRLYTLVQQFGWDLLEGLATSKPLRLPTPQVLGQTIEGGERLVSFAQNDNIAWTSKQQGKSTDFLYPKEGVPTELGAVGVMAEAPSPNAALLFYDWWMSKEAQALLVEGGKYSPRPDVTPPKGNPTIDELKLLTLDYRKYAGKRKKILDRMTDIFGGEWGA